VKGFIVFELAPPVRWRPKLEKSGPMRRFMWLWFSVSIIPGWKWTDFLHTLSKDCTEEEFVRTLTKEKSKKEEWFV